MEAIPIADCAQWRWDGHSLRHEGGHYFSVVGVQARLAAEPQRVITQPMLDQPEIGVMGFLARRKGDQVEWLLQAKSEPGSMHGVQGGPTVQATRSNYQRAHRGRPTPMIDCFVGAPTSTYPQLSDSLQSEQGDRFINKFNRNLLVEVPWHHPVTDDPSWRWHSTSELREALLQDYLINTDARSAMVCSPWGWLSDNSAGAFTRWRQRGGFGEALLQSFEAPAKEASLQELRAALEDARHRHCFVRSLCSLSSLPGWQCTAMGIFPSDDNVDTHSVQTFSVRAPGREVPLWSQPLLVGGQPATVTLLCARLNGILHVLLRLSPEVGFDGQVQFGPSDVNAHLHHRLPWVSEMVSDASTNCVVAVNQSDEGGRFMRSLARYEVREVDANLVPMRDPDGVWLTLSQIQALSRQSGMMTNEARSAISLLLAWA